MPRYFFHVTDGYSIRDAEGTELPDIYAAQDQAIRTSGEILRDMGGRVLERHRMGAGRHRRERPDPVRSPLLGRRAA